MPRTVWRDRDRGHTPRYLGLQCSPYASRAVIVRSLTAVEAVAADEAAAVLGCETVFVEPLQWMGELHGRSGTLACPGCSKQLGFYDWEGAAYVAVGNAVGRARSTLRRTNA